MTSSSILPPGFQFNQGNLRDYDDCRRRFLLGHVREFEWPAPVTAESEALEQAMERGRRFHELVHQDALGVDVSDLVAGSDDEVLETCWRNYRLHPPTLPTGETFHEVEVSVPLAGYRIVARFDRVIFGGDGRVVIVDWKTSEHLPTVEMLRADWQTVIYRYVLVEGGHRLVDGDPIAPEDVSLLYWYTLHPNTLPSIDYSAAEHAKAREQLQALIGEIAEFETVADFAKTDDWSHCERCRYRSYCDRGTVASDDWEIREDELELDVIFDIDV